MMRRPPMIAAGASRSPVSSQSTMATRKIVRLDNVSIQIVDPQTKAGTHSAATDERTGDVRDMRTKNEPENATPVSIAHLGTYLEMTYLHSPTPK